VPGFRVRAAGLTPDLLDGNLRVSDLTIACISDPPE
jgi:hypothetical protein